MLNKIKKSEKNKNLKIINLSKVLLFSLIIISAQYCVSSKTDPVNPPPVVNPVVTCDVKGVIKTDAGSCICPVGQSLNNATNSCEATKIDCSVQGSSKLEGGSCTCGPNSFSDGTKCITGTSRFVYREASDIIFTKNRSITTIFWGSTQGDVGNCSITPALPSGLFLATTLNACSIVGVPIELKEPTPYTFNWISIGMVTSTVHSSIIYKIPVTVSLTVNSISSILWATNFEIITDTTDVTVRSVSSVTYSKILVTVTSSSLWGSTYYYDVSMSSLVYSTVNTTNFNIKVADLYKIFVTEPIYWGNLGGIAGADNKCATQATKKGLTGTYKAMISLSDAFGARSACSSENCLENGILIWTSSKDWVLKDRVNYFRSDEQTFIASSNKAGIFMPNDWINSIGTEADKYTTDNITHYTFNGDYNRYPGYVTSQTWDTISYSLSGKPFAVITGMSNGWVEDGNSSGENSNCSKYTTPTESSFNSELYPIYNGGISILFINKARRTNANTKDLYLENSAERFGDKPLPDIYDIPYNCAAPIYSLYCAEQ